MNSLLIARKLAATDSSPSGTTRYSAIVNPASSSRVETAGPRGPHARPRSTESDTIRTFGVEIHGVERR